MMEFYGSAHNHTDRSNFRLRDSTNRLDQLCWYAAKDLGHNFIAITDHETIATAIDCQKVEKEIRKEYPNFKVIRGNEIYLCRDGLNKDNYERGKDRFWHWILLAKDAIGHEQLREISTRAWSHCFKQGKMLRVPTYYSDIQEVIGANPGHVIMSTACFREGTLVDTFYGKKEIQDIQPGDIILNKDGEWEKVNFPTSRWYSGKGYEVRFLENETPIYCTEDHKFLITSGNKINSYKKNPSYNPLEWVAIKDIILTSGGTKHIALYPINIKYNNNTIIKKNDWEDSMKAKSLKKFIKDTIIITPELMRLFGLFLGDGHISFNEQKNRYAIGFTFNIEEFPYYWESFVKKASVDLGITFNIRERPEHNRVDIESHSVDLCKMFFYLFGNCKANNKRVPDRLKHISPELDAELIFGYFLADGSCRTKKKDKYFIGELTTVSISKDLTKDIQEILMSLGIRSSVYMQKGKRDKNGVNHQDAWTLTSSNNAWINLTKKQLFNKDDIQILFEKAKQHCKSKFIVINNVLYKKVYFKSKQEIEMNEKVYCLNVDSHSFCCNGVIVHNCRGSFISTRILDYAKEPNEELYNHIISYLKNMSDICGKENFFLEVQPSFDKEQILINQTYKKISEDIGFPVIITLDAHYLKKEDESIHHAFLTAQEGDRETSSFYASTYMMSREEIHNYMDSSIGKETVSQWMNNTKLIYDLCEDYDLTKPLHIPYLPKTIDTISEKEFLSFKDLIKELEYFYTSPYDSNRHLAAAIVRKIINAPEEYNNQRTFEEIDDNLKAIRLASEKMNTQWSAYLLNLRDYCNVIWNKGDSLVGPARGSGTGFLLLNMLGVTQINPLKETTKTYSFRFLNPERVSVLDVDIDIEGGKRPQVYKALQDEYGADRVSKVLTIRTEKSKSALLTACRGLGIDPDEASYLSSFIKADRGQTRTLKQTFYGDEEEGILPDKKFQDLMTNKYPEVWKVAQNIEGLCNGVGSHAGGVIFYDEPITKSTALMQTTNGDVCTQFDLHTCEDVS